MSTARCLLLAIPATILIPASADAQDMRRQYYEGGWQWSPNMKFMFIKYRFKPNPGDTEQLHYVIWYPQPAKYRRYLFYFNPKTGLYWCRADAYDRDRLDLWQVLAQPERQGRLVFIDDETWDRHGKERPLIPGATDGARMDPPPPPGYGSD
ncbi:MAG: hypothetical protein IRY99_06905 [Isosphaeraceae bacterium]|nr:hypothetical protein [Isosphaeraceae bacterium]